MPEPVTTGAAEVLAQVVNALNTSLVGFDYDPDAATTADYAADIIRHLTTKYLHPTVVQADNFWA